jgi:hypothetical protein
VLLVNIAAMTQFYMYLQLNQPNLMSKLKLKDYFRVHIDIPTIIIVLLCILIGYRQLANFTFHGIIFLTQKIEFPAWFKDVSINVLSEFIAAAILIFLGYLYFRTKRKPFFAGNFTAYEITKNAGADVKTEWGTLRLTYNIFSKRIKGVLRSTDGKTSIHLDGQFDKERYLSGTYIEKEKPSRLRLGAFLMLLEGDGDNYEGTFIHVSPLTGFDKPELGHAKWEKIEA